MNLYFSVSAMPLPATSLTICVHCTAPVIVMNMFGFLDASVVIGSVTVGAVISSFSVKKSILSLLGELAMTALKPPS